MRVSIDFLIVLIFTLLVSCHSNKDAYTSEEFKNLLINSDRKIVDTADFETSSIYKVYQDEGALGGHSYYVFHKHSSNKYHHFTYSGYKWKNFIVEPCSYQGEVLEDGRWIEVSKSNNTTEINFFPKIDSNLIYQTKQSLLSEGIYLNSRNQLNKVANFSEYCSFEDLNAGIYYLTPPAIMYSSKTPIEEIEKLYD